MNKQRSQSQRSGAASSTGIELLLGAKRRKFLAEHWPDRPFVHHGPIERLGRLTSLPALHGIGDLLAARAAAFQRLTVHDRHGLALQHVEPREAIHFYQRGDLLEVTQLHTTIPALRDVVVELAADLGEPPLHFTCSASAAAGEHGALMHYEAALTFHIQLAGETVWRVAPNRHIENPLIAGDASGDRAPAFGVRPLPDAMPADAMTFRVKPGGVLFIPRGYWHESDRRGESLAVTFSCTPPTWSQRVLHALQRSLESDAAWRGYPVAAGGPVGRDALVQALDALLPQLRNMVDSLQPAALLDAPLSTRGFRWRDGAQPAVVAIERRRGTRHVLRLQGDDGGIDVPFDVELLPIMRWLCARAAPWSAEQARAACPSVSSGYVDALLAELAAQHLIEAA